MHSTSGICAEVNACNLLVEFYFMWVITARFTENESYLEWNTISIPLTSPINRLSVVIE